MPDKISDNLIKTLAKKEAKETKDIWLSVSEAADLGGVGSKTIRRALKESNILVYKIVKDRYKIEFSSLIKFLHTSTKLQNKLKDFGLGQYVETWKK